jgi:hypothetical protein
MTLDFGMRNGLLTCRAVDIVGCSAGATLPLAVNAAALASAARPAAATTLHMGCHAHTTYLSKQAAWQHHNLHSLCPPAGCQI